MWEKHEGWGLSLLWLLWCWHQSSEDGQRRQRKGLEAIWNNRKKKGRDIEQGVSERGRGRDSKTGKREGKLMQKGRVADNTIHGIMSHLGTDSHRDLQEKTPKKKIQAAEGLLKSISGSSFRQKWLPGSIKSHWSHCWMFKPWITSQHLKQPTCWAYIWLCVNMHTCVCGHILQTK